MSDIHIMMNDWALPPMSQFGTRCAGHEGAGVIVQVGERVKHLKVAGELVSSPLSMFVILVTLAEEERRLIAKVLFSLD